MKNILILILSILSITAYSQAPAGQRIELLVPRGQQGIQGPTGSTVTTGSDTIVGGPTTTAVPVGTNPGSNISVGTWIANAFYGKKPPLATLTGGGTYEYTTGTTVSRTLSWSGSRQSNTDPLSTISVTGMSQTYPQSFTNPAVNATVNGTQAVNVTINTTNTFTNTVIAADAQTATATTTFTYQSKYYRGYVATSSPSDADILAATGETVGGSFATSKAVAATLPNPASSSYIIFAFPASFGTATIKINGLAVGYTLTTRSLTNASGYAVSYNIYVSPFATSGGVEYQIL